MPKQIKKHGKIVLIAGLTLILLSMYLLIPQSKAATIGERSITISDSRPGEQNLRYKFQGDHSGDSVKCLEMVFCTTATGGCSDWGGDASGAIKAAEADWSGWTYAAWTASTMTASRVLFTNAAGQVGAGDRIFSATGITNPGSTGTRYARVASYSNVSCSTGVDSGVAAFAVVYGVTVSATVAETLNFTIDLVANNDCDTTFGQLAGPGSTASTVPFGELSLTNTFYHACQDLTVLTNASYGYNVTTQETTSLLDSDTGQTIDDSLGDSGLMSESASSIWSDTDNTGFAYACGNITGSACVMTSTAWYRQFACRSATTTECNPGDGDEAPQQVMLASSATSNESRIQYKINIDVTQSAGDYSNSVVYIATPTY